MHSLETLFGPKSVAIVGASGRSESLSSKALVQLRRYGFEGRIELVNPKYDSIDGLPCYPTVGDIPGSADVALFFIGVDRVIDSVRDAAAAGVEFGIVYSSGFAEANSEGQELEKRLKEVSVSSGIRLLGPNCLGLVNLPTRFVASWTPAVLTETLPDPSAIAYVGQSGAVGGNFFDLGRARGIVPSTWVSTGNQLDITATDVSRHLVEQGSVGLICIYLEQVPGGEAWDDLTASAAAAGVRLAVLRSGRSASGQRAASSHTGALISPNPAFDLLCRDRDVVTVDDIQELVDVAVGWRGGVARRGRRVGVVTTSGGAGSLAADLAEAADLSLSPFSPETQKQLEQAIPSFGTAENPVDVTAQLMNEEPQQFVDVCQQVADSQEIDQLLVVITNMAGLVAENLANALVDFRDRDAGLSLAYLAAEDRTVNPRRILAEGEIAVFSSLAAAVRTIDHLNAPVLSSQGGPAPTRPISADCVPAGEVLTESQGTPVLDYLGIHRPRGSVAMTRPEAEAVAASLKGDLVLKAQSQYFLHKSDFGLVKLGVAIGDVGDVFDQLESQVQNLREGSFEGVLVQELVAPGVELLVGVAGAHNGYPPVVTVGMGGRFVEVYKDVASSIAPLGRDDAVALINSLRGSAILNGARNTQSSDVESAAAAVEELSQLAVAMGDELAELEINPLIVHSAGHGVTAVDLLIRRTTA